MFHGAQNAVHHVVEARLRNLAGGNVLAQRGEILLVRLLLVVEGEMQAVWRRPF
jgi:hypothetical protein